jgi:hypothetical protein
VAALVGQTEHTSETRVPDNRAKYRESLSRQSYSTGKEKLKPFLEAFKYNFDLSYQQWASDLRRRRLAGALRQADCLDGFSRAGRQVLFL